MDTDGPYKQEFHIRNLPTRCVTLFPTRAQIVRDIKNVTLKPGPNEITVVGVTPTADEHSIKVEGTGSAVITDMTVELLPNREIFEEIYPDSDSEKEESSESSSSDEEDAKSKSKEALEIEAKLEELREKLVTLGDEQKRAQEIIASAESRLEILDCHGRSLDRKDKVDIEASIETYRQEREKTFKDHMDGVAQERAIAKELLKLHNQESRLLKLKAKEDAKVQRAKAKVRRAKEKLREKQRRRDDEKKKEKDRIRKEREQFWPRSVYTVRISLDAAPQLTPTSSRRSSVASAADVKVVSAKEAADDTHEAAAITCDLTLTYLTTSAYWTPSYDLSLSTLSNTASLSFDARMYNMTSETWTSSKVILSTSQASFSGLQDDVPTLVPWRLRFGGKLYGNWDALDIAYSNEENYHKLQWNAAQNAQVQKPRAALFGKGSAPQLSSLKPRNKLDMPPGQESGQQSAKLAFGGPQPQRYQPAFGVSRHSTSASTSNNNNDNSLGSLYCSPPGAAVISNVAPTLFAASGSVAPPTLGVPAPPAAERSRALPPGLPSDAGLEDEGGGGDEDADGQTMLDEGPPEVGFQDSSFEETGLTATYDLPHLKTLRPSATPSKQRVARAGFSGVTFVRTVVAKYKPAAYLRARLRNASKLTILKGPVGLTLDGTFLGRSTLPRCSAGDTFSVALGVDPAVRVAYPKPDVSRATTGVFSKGEHSLYTRSVTLVNTRAGAAGRPVSVTVVDQIPVSEEEKLRVGLVQPAGLVEGGKPVATGLAVKDETASSSSTTSSSSAAAAATAAAEWGKAWASLRKAGEVQWDVTLNAGKSVKLVLQYEVAFPAGERVVQVQ
ncbi:hypothetical protein VTJ83DRAFT_5070 [Remersonia thermophila]|uniref:DUF4139 domain-containing protein n=1 Tax=Remersonia thermophila TaxID=72144 RepID=A0ABR4DBT2_9PEZI